MLEQTLILLGVLLLAMGAAPAARGGQAKAPGPVDWEAVDRYVEAERSAARIPGLALGVVQGGETVYLRGYGSADSDGRPVTPQTPFILGSVSKSFTALAVMQLVEAGQVDLDAPVQRYLPWFQAPDPAATQAITVRHLLHHTSGYSTHAGELAFFGAPRSSMQDLALRYGSVPLTAPVGQRHQYSNVNYILLGAVVEAASGQPFGEYVQEHVFAPLGMAHSHVSQEAAEADGLALGYRPLWGYPRPVRAPFRPANLASGYLAASAEDMCRYLAMWMGQGSYDGATLLTPAGAAEAQAPAAEVTRYTRYAMGWYSNPEGTVVWHGGSTVNYRAQVKILHQEDLAVVVLCNVNDDLVGGLLGQEPAILDGVISILYGERPRAAGGLGSAGTYAVLDGAALLAVAGIALSLARLGRWRAAWASSRRRLWGGASLLIVNLALPLAVLLGVGRRAGWSVVLAAIPDFGYLVVIVALALLAIGVAKVVLLLLPARRPAAVG